MAFTIRTGALSAISLFGSIARNNRELHMWDFVCNFELIKVIYLYITKLLKLFDMTKPQLVKVEALFYVLQQI